VFGGGEQDTLLHEAGGIANASDVVAMGFDGEVVKINAAEDDAGIRGSGEETKVCVYTGVETHTLSFDCAVDCGLKHKGYLIRVAHCRPNTLYFVLCIQ